MNFARIGLAAAAAWIVSMPMGYLVNDVILRGLLDANAPAFRPEADLMANLPIGFAFMLAGFLVFAYAYAKGYEGTSGVVEGVRFGVVVALMLNGFVLSWWWAMMPLDKTLIGAMMVDYVVEYALYGAIVGLIYKPLPKARAAA